MSNIKNLCTIEINLKKVEPLFEGERLKIEQSLKPACSFAVDFT